MTLSEKKIEKIDKKIDETQDKERKKFLGLATSENVAKYLTELGEELHIKGSDATKYLINPKQIVCTSALTPNRAVNQYRDYFEALGLNVKNDPKDIVLVLCINTARAAEVVFELNTVNNGQGTMKLYKAEESDPSTNQEKTHLESPLSIAISTPTRVRFLHKLKVLDFKRVHRIVLDCSYFDHKDKNVLDNKDTIETVEEIANLGGLIYVF